MRLNNFLVMHPAIRTGSTTNWTHYSQHITLNDAPITLNYSLPLQGKTAEDVSRAVVKAIDDKLVTIVALMPTGSEESVCQQVRERYTDHRKLAVFLRQALVYSGLGFIDFVIDTTIA